MTTTVKELKKDFNGSVLKIGDTVVYVAVGGKKLMEGKIVKLNPKQATIETHETYTDYSGKKKTAVSTPSRYYALIVKMPTEKHDDLAIFPSSTNLNGVQFPKTSEFKSSIDVDDPNQPWNWRSEHTR